jgi:peptidoglycan/LPS O-acetylase OafA/YrhL
LNFDEYHSRRHVPALDALRAVSVLLVITVHVHFGHWAWLGGVNGVTIFFVISGYLITTLAIREEAESGKLSIPAFYARRTFRIFPMYYLTIGIYAILILGLNVSPDKTANFIAVLPYHLTYLSEVPFFFGIHGAQASIPLYHAWSLGIEEKFYLFWPCLIFLVPTPALRRLTVCAALLVLAAAAPRLISLGALFFPYFHILAGCFLAISLSDERIFKRLRFLGTGKWFWIFAGLLAVIHLLTPYYSYFPFDQNINVVYGVVVALLLATIVLSTDLTESNFSKSLARLGRLSYGVYLFHILCINLVEVVLRRVPHVPDLFIGLLDIFCAALLATGFAWIASVLFERPLIKMGHRISDRLKSRNDQAAARNSPATDLR